MTDETIKHMRHDFELRGWKEICEFLECEHKSTAKKRLKRMDLLVYDANTPVLNKLIYQKESLRLHLTLKK